MRALSLIAAIAGLLAVPAPVRAWTDAQVTSARAEVAVAPDASAQVQVELQVEVRGGWLEGLELAGFEEEMQLDEGSVVFVSDEGERLTPRVRVRDDGRIQLRFARRSAPRRGRYRVRLHYGTDLAPHARADGDAHALLSWTMPGWRSGLDGVEVTLALPGAQADFAPDESERATVQRERSVDRAAGTPRTQLRWRRAHLPRTLPWEVTARVPRADLDPGVVETPRPPNAAPPPPTALGDSEAPDPRWPFLVLALLCVGWLTVFARRAGARGALPRGVLPMPTAARVVVAVVACGAGAFVSSVPLLFACAGLAALAVVERAAGLRAPRVGRWCVLGAGEELPETGDRWRLLDVHHGVGAALWIALGAAGFALHLHLGEPPALAACWLAAAVALLGTGESRLPVGLAQRLARLRSVDRQDDAWVVVHRVGGTEGAVQDVRLRWPCRELAEGLLRCDLVVADDGLRTALHGLVVTRAGSAADAIVAARLGDAREGPGGRRAYVCAPDALHRLRDALASTATEHAPRRSGVRRAASAGVLRRAEALRGHEKTRAQ